MHLVAIDISRGLDFSIAAFKEMCSSEMVTALLLMPSRRTKYAISLLPDVISSNYKFISYGESVSECSGTFVSLQDVLEDLKKTISVEKVDIVLSNSDKGSLLQAALVQEFTHLQGPSVESVFLCYNKYYTRRFLDPQPIPYACLDLSAADLDRACEDVLQEVGIPAFFKPCCDTGSMGIASIMSSEELKHFAQFYIQSKAFTSNDINTEFMNPFYDNNIDVNKYPLARKPTAIVEKHMGKTVRVNADGYVFRGETFHWSISDNLYSSSKPCYYLGVAHPTMLPEHAQQKVWNLFDTVVAKMVDYGFDNKFVNVEMFVLDTGDPKVMEINPRKGGSQLCSEYIYGNGNVTSAQLKLAEGKNPEAPVPNGRHAFYGYIRTCGSGRASDLYNYSYTRPRLIPEEYPDHLVDGTGESGAALARTVLSGDSHEEVLEEYWMLCRQVLLKPELSIWN